MPVCADCASSGGGECHGGCKPRHKSMDIETQSFIVRIAKLIARIDFWPIVGDPAHAYHFEVKNGHGGVYLLAWYWERDIYSVGQPGPHPLEKQQTRKWLLSPSMTDSEIVQTAFKCCITSMEHRVREGFLYKGKRIFGPHFDVEDLVKLQEDKGGRNSSS